jgi:HEAT repeat protein
MYRGPGPTPILPPIAGPGTGGAVPAGPTTPDPNSIPVSATDPTSWQFWWEFNKDQFLRLKEAVRSPGPIVGSDEFFMSGQTTSRLVETLAPSEAEKRDIILPSLKQLLASSSSKDIATACMVAMAKIGFDHPDFGLLPIFRKELARGNQEIRETAALCFGITGRRDALEDVLVLLRDEPRGRRMVDAGSVDDRTRSFAAYAAGLIGANQRDTETKETIFTELARLLEDRSQGDRDLLVAAIQGLSLLRPDPRVPSQKRLLWKVLEKLRDFYGRDLGKGDQVVQAHVPTAAARLLGRGTSPDHSRFKAMLAEELRESRTRHDSIYQSIALALGGLAVSQEDDKEEKAWSDALADYADRGKDQQARFFCLIAMGRIGGDTNRERLLEHYVRGAKGTTRPWAALALGVLAFQQRERTGADHGDPGIGQALLHGLRNVENEDHRAATAIALGLCNHPPARDEMLRLIDKYERRDMVGGYLCIGLSLLGAVEAIPDIRNLVSQSVRRPMLLTQGAIALGKLGRMQALCSIECSARAIRTWRS